MKKLSLSRLRRLHPAGQALAVLALIAFLAGCQKSEPVALTEVTAHLLKANSSIDQTNSSPDEVNTTSAGPQVDELILDSTHEIVVPINKTGEWPRTDQAPVAVRIVDTGKRLGQLRVVFIVTLREI